MKEPYSILLITNVFSWLLQACSHENTKKLLDGALSSRLIKFFALTIVLSAVDEITDILSSMDYFRYSYLYLNDNTLSKYQL